MIFDSLHHAGSYFIGDWWDETIAYIRSATPLLPDGVHQVRGDMIVARVHTGQTAPRAHAMLESHRAHVDVHVVLEGQDSLIVWPASRLRVRTPYNQTQDVVFYDPPAEGGVAFTLEPGSFAVLFPQDAHMTQLLDQRPVTIKKLVMKVSVGLIGNHPRRR